MNSRFGQCEKRLILHGNHTPCNTGNWIKWVTLVILMPASGHIGIHTKIVLWQHVSQTTFTNHLSSPMYLSLSNDLVT